MKTSPLSSPFPPPAAPLANRPRLALPLGDPAGIGPEVVLKAITQPVLHTAAHFTLIGDMELIYQTLHALDKPLDSLPPHITIREALDHPLDLSQLQPGNPTPATGHASFTWLEVAIAETLAGNCDAIVTAPIAKSVWHAAGHCYPGQTEVLAERAGCDRFGMAFIAQSPHTNWQLRCLLATTHIPLGQVPSALTPTLMTQKLSLLIACLQQDFGIAAPHVAIAGLNPHSGENGKLGTEEQTWLTPWLEESRDRYPHLTLSGPVPPDTLWVSAGQAWHHTPSAAPYDGYLALYHDQGLIPVKLLAFDRAVNTTIGLPFIRTSPDHGTAFDIAGQGIARPDSMIAAIELAIALVHQRRRSRPPSSKP